jgi:hypothetical protein
MAVVAALLLAITLNAPAASAKTHLKLTGVVTGHKGANVTQSKISVRKGKRAVGKLTVINISCGGQICDLMGTAKLTVGRVKGSATLDIKFVAGGSGCAVGAPTCKPAKSGNGNIFKGATLSGSKKREAIHINVGQIPTSKGSRFKITLIY